MFASQTLICLSWRPLQLPSLDMMSCLMRRKRPFLIRPLENTLIKLLKSLDFYDELGRDKIAIGARLSSSNTCAICKPAMPHRCSASKASCKSQSWCTAPLLEVLESTLLCMGSSMQCCALGLCQLKACCIVYPKAHRHLRQPCNSSAHMSTLHMQPRGGASP